MSLHLPSIYAFPIDLWNIAHNYLKTGKILYYTVGWLGISSNKLFKYSKHRKAKDIEMQNLPARWCYPSANTCLCPSWEGAFQTRVLPDRDLDSFFQKAVQKYVNWGHLQAFFFFNGSSANTCKVKNHDRPGVLVLPFVRNASCMNESCWFESVMLNSVCPDVLPKYTSSISLNSTYTPALISSVNKYAFIHRSKFYLK